MNKPYIYRREDNDELIEVDYATMQTQDFAGYITLPDGVPARRCLYLELERDGRPERRREIRSGTEHIVSNAAGFTEGQHAEMEEHRQRKGHSGISFHRDKDVPGFFQVHAESRRAFNRYIKDRGLVQKSGIGGLRLTQEDLDRAAELVKRHTKRKQLAKTSLT